MTHKEIYVFTEEDGVMVASLSASDKEKRETSHLLCIQVPTSPDHPQIQVCQIRGVLVTP